MSVTDMIVEDIVRILAEQSWKKFSRAVIREDYLEGFADELVDEIERKLKTKGIEVDS